MEERLTVQYLPGLKDYVRASRTLAMKTRSFVLIGLFALLAMVASAVILLVPSIGDASWRNIAVIVLLAGAFYFVYVLVIVPMELSRTYKNNEHLQMERKFFFSDSNVTMQVGDQVSVLDWNNIHKAVKGSGLYLLIYVADQRIIPIIPERAFETEEAKAQFLDLLKGKNIPVK